MKVGTALALLATIPAAGSACFPGEAHLAVRTVDRPGSPLAGLEILALPVNVDSLLDSLAAAAPKPKPTFPRLEAEMAGYQTVYRAPAGPGAAWEATRDSVTFLADTLRTINRASIAYREAYGRLRGLYDRLSQRAAARDRTLQGEMREDRGLALRAGRAADSLRRWEQLAYADFPTRLADAVRQAGRDAQQQVTDSSGLARLVLSPGRWWVQARVRDVSNPFEELYWNVPVTLTRLVPVVLPLSDRTARRRWRH